MKELSFTPAAQEGYNEVLATAGITMAPVKPSVSAPAPATIKPAV